MTQSVHPPKSWALNFWKMKFLHFPFFSRAEDFLSQGNTSLRISIKFHFSIWLNTIHLKKLHIIKRYVSIYERFIKTFSLKWIIFQHDANRPTLHLWALHHIFFFKINQFFEMTQAVQPSIHGRFMETFCLEWISFSKWRKPSDPSFVGASSYIFFKMNQSFKMTQPVPPSIYGRFIKTFSWKSITFSTWRKPSDPSFVGASSYIFLENDSIL